LKKRTGFAAQPVIKGTVLNQASHGMAVHEKRLAIYYAILFGSIGLTGPFFAPWLVSLGVDTTLIGTIVALPSFAMVVTTLYLGSAADRLSDWRSAIIASDWVVVLLLSWLLFRHGIADIIVVWTLTGLLIAAKIPVLDAATLSVLRRQGGQYGPIRAIGSVGFVVALLLAGALYDLLAFDLFIWCLVMGALVRAIASMRLPRLREPALIDRESTMIVDEPVSVANLTAPAGNLASSQASFTLPSLEGGLRHPGFLLVLSGAAMINASHAFFVGFGVLHWLESGITKSVASMLFTCAVVAEIILMWKFASVAKRFSARYCMIIASCAGLVRWSVSTMELSIAYLFAVQTLHALTYGLLFVSTVNFIARRVDDSIAAKAQSLYATLTTGALAVAVMVSGAVYDSIGIVGYWLMAAMCLAGAMLVAASFRTTLTDDSQLS